MCGALCDLWPMVGTHCQTVAHLERFMCNGTLGSASHVTVIVMRSALMPTHDAHRRSISVE